MLVISFIVWGRPQPQGSMRAFKHKTSGAVINVPDNKKTKPWKQEISGTARNYAAVPASWMEDQPIAVCLDFYFQRPKSTKRERPTVKPDIDKVIRACLDALTGIIFRDDSQVVRVQGRKFYGAPERVEITVSEECG